MREIEKNTDQAKDHLREAFWQLYSSREMNTITVKEVCERAGYNRGTFYRYYHDIEDILEQIEEEIMDQFDERYAQIARVNRRLDFFQIVKYTLAPCTIYDKYLAVMLGPGGDAEFLSRLKERTKAFLRSLLKRERMDARSEYYLEFCVSGIFACTRMWYAERETMDIHDYISMVIGFIQLPLFDLDEELITREKQNETEEHT